MASSFLEQMARQQAEKLEKQYGSSAYGGTTWLNEQLRKKKKDEEEDDIAPVVTTKDEEERTWFQKGALDDGFSLTNIGKSILGTLGDVASDLTTGVVGMGEKVVDAGAYLAGGVGKLVGADEFASDMEEFIKKDLYDERKVANEILSGLTTAGFSSSSNMGIAPVPVSKQELAIMEEQRKNAKDYLMYGAEEDSVLGDKSDALVQSAGQLGATMGLQAVGVPWFVTTGATSFGGEVENALNQGASYGKAGASAAISAGAEILSEKLSGGISFGGKTLDDLWVKQLTSRISDKTLRTMAKFGIDAVGEGTEEIISQVFSNLGSSLYREESLSELLASEEAIDEYIESFIGGAVLGGGSSVVGAVKANKEGVDTVTGMTANEQKVIDKVVEDRIAEEESDGKKLTNKEKEKIHDAVVSDMEKGYISTDTIEEVLGGETYKAYKDTVDSEDALQKEFDTLNKMKQGEMTGEQIDRRAELKAQLEEIKASDKRNQMKSKLGEEVFGLVRSDRLAESYNERGRRSQAFEADLTKYDAKQQETVKKAVESGILNNSRRTHEFVDMIAKITADKGVLFDFANNQKLKDSGFAMDGKTVNGYVTKDGVTLNIDSAKSLNSVVGHEITHVLEGTELYDALQQTIVEYAKSKGDYQGRYDALAKLYEGVKDANVDAELTADLVGDYLFTDSDFINNLSTNHRNVFQKVYDEIKYLAKVATAGSKEARELEKVKRAFEKAYKESGKAVEGTKYSLADAKVPTRAELKQKAPVKVVDISTPQTKGTFAERRKQILANASEVIAKPYQNHDTGALIFLTEKSYKHAFNNLGEIQLNAAEHLPELIENAILTHAEPPTHGSEYANGVYTFFAAAKADSVRPVKLKVKEYTYSGQDLPKNIQAYFDSLPEGYAASYDTVVLEVEEIEKSPSGSAKDMNQNDSFLSPDELLTIKVADLLNLVKGDAEKYIPKYSLSDSDGKQLTKEQQEYFKESKVRDENGNLKVMYHGSQAAGFHVFDAKMSDDDTSFFFVDRNDVAASYSGTSEVYEAKTIRTAEDMNNFLAEIGQSEDYSVIEKDGKFELIYDGDRVASSDTAQGIYEEFCWYEGVGEGDANYKVYLNLKNPLVVDAKGKNWNNISREFSQEVYDRYQSLTSSEKTALAEIAGWGEYGIFRDEILSMARAKANGKYHDTDLASAYEKLGGANANWYDAFSISQDDFSEESLREFAVKQMNTRDYAKKAKEQGYDGVIFNNIVDVGGYGNGSEGAATVAIAFDSNQIKSVANEKPTADKDIRYSLSEYTAEGEMPKTYGKYNVAGKDIRLETQEETQVESEEVLTSAPESKVAVAENATTMFPEDAPIQTEIERLEAEKAEVESRLATDIENAELNARWYEIQDRIEALRAEEDAEQSDRLASLEDADAPPEMEAPVYEDAPFEDGQAVDVEDPFADRDVPHGNEGKKVNAYMYDNPEVKPFFQAEALALMEELNNGMKGERWYNDKLYYDSGGTEGFGGTKRHQSESIDRLSYEFGLSYADIEKGLEAIIKDHGAENIAAAKKIEFVINDRLMYGYKPFGASLDPDAGRPNQDYIAMLQDKQRVDSLTDEYAPPVDEDIAPVMPMRETAPKVTEKYEAIRPKPAKEPKLAKATPAEQARAEILTEEPKVEKKNGAWGKFKNLVLDKGMVFEDLSLATGNRELQARWNSIRYAESKAQRLMEEGNASVSSLKSIRETVEKSGKTKQFYEYLYHMHNADRMTLAQRFKDTPNKPVFGNSVTADVSTEAAANLERANPEFKQYAKEVYGYMGYLREMLVDGGVISGETAKLWQEMYPHYVPIRRMGDEGMNINVPLDTGRTGINAPVKKATGGNRDILPLFDTMGQRTIQTYKAIAKNRFGVELKNTLGSPVENEAFILDELIDGIDGNEELLKKGENGKPPTFTVFDNGEKVTFEITEEMYDSMKPTDGLLSTTNKTLNTISNIRRGTLTEYNPWFLLKNAVKDAQDVLINSQHATRTYLSVPKALKQMATNGHWYAEYMENGGDQNSYFDTDTNTFKAENKALEIAKTVTGLNAISKANNIVERIPRLAEYIASREMGRSVDVAMLDAARVTTNFAAGGDATKWLNRNGATFLNASVQGAMQQARNIREAKMNGLKGWASLAGKFVVAGLPAVALNHLLWDDDEEYEELADYVKENYYIVGKYGDGQFVRIPKGRTVAVIQNAFEQMENAITGNDEVDLKTFLDLVVTNLAPNNPLDNNILSPIVDVATNEAWYGEDLVPTRLQDLPAAEQYDESTDSISRWLGDTFNVSPYKANYLLDQYSGVIGDTFLPYLTPEAEGGENSMLAPLKDMFTTDSVMNNQNVSSFYDKKDELTVNANSSKATDKDILMSKYMNSVSSEMGELYGQKREIQNSTMSDAAKYEKVREIQNQIDSIARDSLNAYQNVSIDGVHATVADRQYRLKDGTWTKLTDEQIEKQEKVTNGLGIRPSEYWSNKEEYDFAYEKPEKYAVAKSVGGYEAYKGYSGELYDIKGEDRDGDGRSDTGTRKEKVLDWINDLDADYGTKIILFKSEYNADDTYNYDIIDYLNGREDISYEEMVTILKELGFEVSGNNISW